jgi:hypothetical protein
LDVGRVTVEIMILGEKQERLIAPCERAASMLT